MVNVPNVEWREWTTTIDPSGIRISDDTATLNASGFQGVRSTIAGETLVFDPVNIAVTGQITETRILTARVESWGDASGIFNMKFYLKSINHFGVGNYRFLYNISTHFASGLELDLTDDDILTSIPNTQNLFSTLESGSLVNTGFYDESQVTQYVYLATWINTDVPVGTYGGAGSAGFRYRLLYDFS
jgi:hypothetical protein